MLSKKNRKWLEHVRQFSKPGDSMYTGVRVDHLPRKATKALSQLDYITLVCPHNLAHKERWIITNEGREALK